MTLKELRKQNQMTQVECASYLGVPTRTYQNYENDVRKKNSLKYEYMMQKLKEYGRVDENHGILTVQKIKVVCEDVFSSYDVDYCYLFGSYAKGLASDTSDVDLLISTPVSGIQFFDLVEALREELKKNVDLLNLEQLTDNPELLNEILKDGVRIYG
jgi:predicted nucleotidyltransferase